MEEVHPLQQQVPQTNQWSAAFFAFSIVFSVVSIIYTVAHAFVSAFGERFYRVTHGVLVNEWSSFLVSVGFGVLALVLGVMGARQTKKPFYAYPVIVTAIISFALYIFLLGIPILNGLKVNTDYLNQQKQYQETVVKPQQEQIAQFAKLGSFGLKISNLLIKQDAQAVKELIDPNEISLKGQAYFDRKITNEWLPFFNNPMYTASVGGAPGEDVTCVMLNMYVYDKPGQENFKYYLLIYTNRNDVKYLVDVNTQNTLEGKDYTSAGC